MTAATSKRFMDVEDLVRWACGALQQRDPGAPVPRAMNTPRSEASLVGRWDRPIGFPTVSPMFEAAFPKGSRRGSARPDDPDALAVEAAIAALPARVASFTAPEELAIDIGLDVDIEGAFAAPLANVSNIVLAHGRLGNRPPISADVPRPRPKPAANGKPGVWQLQCSLTKTIGGEQVERLFEAPVQSIKRDLYPHGSFCVLEYDPNPQSIVNDRADYLVWRLALDELAAMLSGQLERIAVLPPAAAFAPWLGDRDGDRPRDLFGPGADRVYSPNQRLAIEARRLARSRRPIPISVGKLRRPVRPGRGRMTG